MTNAPMNLGISLPEGTTASSLLHDLMRESVATESDMVRWTGRFGVDRLSKEKLPDSVLLFEALRAGSSHRLDIARKLVAGSQDRLVFRTRDGHTQPIAAVMDRSADPLPLTTMDFSAPDRWETYNVPYQGGHYHGGALGMLAASMADEHKISKAASQALQWIANQGKMDLAGSQFVVLGAGAELAPTQVLLAGGAKVLWIDVETPERFISSHAPYNGVLVYPTQGANLLMEPDRIAATISEFAQGDPFHIGAFAYVGGNAMEWRLTAAMNAIVKALDPQLVASLSLYISPSAPSKAEAEDARHGLEHRKGFLKLLSRLGLLKENHFTLDQERTEAADPQVWVNTIVPRQGASYLAAQYIEKRLMAEVAALDGLRPDVGPLTVSANVAGISDTRSMKLPTFQAGFAGAPSLGLEIYQPETTRWMSALLMLHDLLNPEAPGAAGHRGATARDKADTLFSEQVHGGVFAHPYALDKLLILATLIGIAKRPALLPGVLRGK